MDVDTRTQLLPADLIADKAAADRFAALQIHLDYLPPADVKRVHAAYRFADQAHDGQLRHSGEPYITHPLAVANLCAQWKLDPPALMAALLHDVMEDCGVAKTTIVERFGAPVADLVDGLTKLDQLRFNTREEGQAESFRKMLLAMARDVRVILIKLADRTHNMRTMSDMPRHKWHRIAAETLEVYVPIARRLGFNRVYDELQNLAFRYLQPWRYAVLEKAAAKARSRRRSLIETVQQAVQNALQQGGLSARVVGQEKTLYAIYHAMEDGRRTFAQVNDVYNLRVILPGTIECYTALGLLHQLYKPVPGRFRDHIAMPKVNGYQSLHTAVIGPASLALEFQIRTEIMDMVAESGVTAHWLYQVNHKNGAPDYAAAAPIAELGTRWLQSLLDIQHETPDSAEFWDNVKVDLFPDAIYVFTPKGRVLALPQGATPVDFAYAIHSDIGDHAVAAKVNGEQVPLRTELTSGDVVEVVTAPVSTPNPAWLGFVRTGRARSKIRHHLKSLQQSQSRELGEQLLAQALRAEGLHQPPDQQPEQTPMWDQLARFTGSRSREDMLTSIGLGKCSANAVAKRMVTLLAAQGIRPDALLMTRERYTAHEHLSQGAVLLDGAQNVSIRYAGCCLPVPGDAVVGYLGRGEGLVVHTEECAVARRLRQKDAERFVTVAWADEPVHTFETGVIVTIANETGVLARVTAALARLNVSIVHLVMPDSTALSALDLRIVIKVKDRAQLETVLRTLRRTPSVSRAERAGPSEQTTSPNRI
ncbi:MAG: bifunctional (p)ppGpp synthetase/guanosine-3',5'-bis(diphosphate) 3'-pyrophosphohydrolase [Burkholderiaceae bacterium]|jgi:GTP pyrophosphokinase|nr:bifunctional (p)ppGpp synthetase/guanosine-3',5'-bis(diphosphate) 3'-pyrophosphohydrolase [Burkholderiaceae bacterium]